MAVDLEAPTLTKVEVASSNANTQGQTDQLAKAGDTITLTVESSEALKSLSVVGGDGSPTPLTAVGDTGREWTLSKPVESGENGELSFTLNYEDLAGNDGSSNSDTTNNSRITFDTTAPTLSSVTLASSNAATNLAKSDDTLTLAFTSSEPITSPTVTLVGDSETLQLSSNSEKTEWSAVYRVKASEVEREVTYSISYQDAAG